MALLSRLFDFQPATVIVSADVDSEFNQLVNILNGTSTNKDALIKFSDATNPVLRVDQISTGAIQQWLQNGTEKVSIRNNGALRINSTQAAADPVKLAISSDANNLGAMVASIQTVGSGDIAMRLAMEAATGSTIPALQVTKFDSSVVQSYCTIRNSGEIRVAAGYPALMSNVPTGTGVTLGGQHLQNVSTVGNVTTGEDDLHSYTIAANVLANDGDSLDFVAGGRMLAAGTTKQYRAFFGGTAIFTSGLFDPAGDIDWLIVGTITRISSSAVIAVANSVVSDGVIGGGNNALAAKVTQVGSLSFTGTLILKFTGQDTDGVSDRVTQVISVVRKFARAQ